MERPDLSHAELIDYIADVIVNTLHNVMDSRSTDDSEDENGDPIEPIHRYAAHLVKETTPLAIMGCFLVLCYMVRKQVKKDLES